MTTPLHRYLGILTGLKRAGHWQPVADWQRLGAAVALADDRPAADVAQAMDRAAYTLRNHAGWSPELATPAQWPVAGMVVGLGLDPHRFAYECETARTRLREAGLPDLGSWAPAVVAVLRQWPGRWPVAADTVEAMQALFSGMKATHRWLTGADDVAICAALIGAGGVIPEAIAQIEEGLTPIYPWSGNDIQAAASVLALCEEMPVAAVAEFQAVIGAMADLRSDIWQADPAVVALLVVGGAKPAAIAAELVNAHAEIAKLTPSGQPWVALAAAAAVHGAGRPHFHAASEAGRRLRSALAIVIARLEHRLAAIDPVA